MLNTWFGSWLVKFARLALVSLVPLSTIPGAVSEAASVHHSPDAFGLYTAGWILIGVCWHFALGLLPCLAGCLYAIRRGVRDELLVGLIALATLGASGYIAFWLWLASPALGRGYGALLPIAALMVSIRNWRHVLAEDRHCLRRLAIPTALTAVTALLVVSAGFGYGGLEAPLLTPAVRFSHPQRLTEDNALPFLLAGAMLGGKIPSPLYGDWLSSDRPPLQTGIVLSHYPYFLGHPDLDYTIISVELQSLWLFALWLLCAAFDINRGARRLLLVTTLFSGFIFLNSFFVWPKLLAAVYVTAASAIFLAGRFASIRRTAAGAVLAGVLSALALLSHGGSAFSLLALGVMVAFGRSWPKRTILVALMTAALVLLPWTLYQKYYDPPGDRLFKMHLAGVSKATPGPFLSLFVDAYHHLTVDQWLQNKYANLKTLGYQARVWSGARQLAVGNMAGASALRQEKYFNFFSELDVLVIGLLAVLPGFRRRSTESSAAGTLWVFVGLSVAIWSALMFEPGSTVIHQGSYASVLFSYGASVVGLWSVSPRLARLTAYSHIGFNILLYVVLLRPGEPVYALLALAVASTAVLLLLLRLEGAMVCEGASGSTVRAISEAPTGRGTAIASMGFDHEQD